jgi:hypothetical protein
MIIWNFRNPLTFIASIIWNVSEFYNLPLGRFAPIIFGLVVKSKGKKIIKKTK